MRLILLVGLGSFIGGVSRYLISLFIVNRGLIAFPYGTLTVNIVGCFLIGIVYGITERVGMTNEWRLFLATGILGGFTTFSAFSYESISLLRDGQSGAAFLYVICSVVFGLLATWAGMSAAS
ncbi:MAG: fluoride efflux transporter CrcB [Daejeonella sp.]|uniref:fluoride efflux transporter CrcB n=1 Tax=Daejeonella sp. TaxID=2805397 RepID=UPI003C755C0D